MSSHKMNDADIHQAIKKATQSLWQKVLLEVYGEPRPLNDQERKAIAEYEARQEQRLSQPADVRMSDYVDVSVKVVPFEPATKSAFMFQAGTDNEVADAFNAVMKEDFEKQMPPIEWSLLSDSPPRSSHVQHSEHDGLGIREEAIEWMYLNLDKEDVPTIFNHCLAVAAKLLNKQPLVETDIFADRDSRIAFLEAENLELKQKASDLAKNTKVTSNYEVKVTSDTSLIIDEIAKMQAVIDKMIGEARIQDVNMAALVDVNGALCEGAKESARIIEEQQTTINASQEIIDDCKMKTEAFRDYVKRTDAEITRYQAKLNAIYEHAKIV